MGRTTQGITHGTSCDKRVICSRSCYLLITQTLHVRHIYLHWGGARGVNVGTNENIDHFFEKGVERGNLTIIIHWVMVLVMGYTQCMVLDPGSTGHLDSGWSAWHLEPDQPTMLLDQVTSVSPP